MTIFACPSLRIAMFGLFAATLAACASAPVQQDFSAPARKPADAKTQLESGRNYR